MPSRLFNVAPGRAFRSGASRREDELDLEAIVWRDKVIANGGTLWDDSVTQASKLIRMIKTSSLNSKIVYLLPMLGQNIVAARTPLRDSLGVGLATNNNFTDSNFSQKTGLQGGNPRSFDLGMKVSQLGTGNSGGFGYWENNYGSGGWAIGVYPSGGDGSEIYGIDLTGGTNTFWYGSSGVNYSGTFPLSSGGGGHFYAQRSSSTSRKIYFEGALNVTNNTAHNTNNINLATNIHLCAMKGHPGGTTFYYGNGRCSVAYLTDGTLTDDEVALMHFFLLTYVLKPSNR